MIIQGKHKRFDLAERHRVNLERQYGYARIRSRKNKAGTDSALGHFYRFFVRANSEYLVSIKYKETKRRKRLRGYDFFVIYKQKQNGEQLRAFIYNWAIEHDDFKVSLEVLEIGIVDYSEGKPTGKKWIVEIRSYVSE